MLIRLSYNGRDARVCGFSIRGHEKSESRDSIISHVHRESLDSQKIIESDDDIDIEHVGLPARGVTSGWHGENGKPVHRRVEKERVFNPDGTEREFRDAKATFGSLNDTGIRIVKTIPISDFIGTYVPCNAVQIAHTNALSRDFMHGIARHLCDGRVVAAVGNVILRDGGNPHMGFVEGRVDGDKYCLILWLSRLEMKAPAECTGKTVAGIGSIVRANREDVYGYVENECYSESGERLRRGKWLGSMRVSTKSAGQREHYECPSSFDSEPHVSPEDGDHVFTTCYRIVDASRNSGMFRFSYRANSRPKDAVIRRSIGGETFLLVGERIEPRMIGELPPPIESMEEELEEIRIDEL